MNGNIEFIYDKTIKRPKRLQNNVFVLHSPERIKIQPGEFKKIDMKRSTHLRENIITTCLLFLSENGLKLDNSQYISTENNIVNLNQSLNLPWKLQLDTVYRSLNFTFSIRKKQEIGFIVPLNEGINRIQVKYTKT